MAKLKFDESGKHFYEMGVSKGVLYVKGANGYGEGVAWDGLTNVTLSPEGGEANDIYADNIKYASFVSAESLNATIEAYQSPEEFDVCDGTAELVANSGVTVGQQDRAMFGLCFRTEIGNDESQKKGYKIHILYGCLAAPSERGYDTINDSPDAMTLSWEVSTTPVEIKDGLKPSSLITIDSTKVAAAKLTELEDALYGTTDNYEQTTDSDIVPGKKYYTRSGSAGSYVYTLVENPVVGDIGTYYENTTNAKLLMPNEIINLLSTNG